MPEPEPRQSPPTSALPPSPPGRVRPGVNDPRPTPAVDPADRSAVAADAGPLPAVAGYQVIGVLGRGGMGVVYRARQLKLNRLVALKMVLAGAHAAPETVARFKTEAEAVAQLQHPNIVQIYDIGEHQGLPFFAMELVEGPSLAEQLGHGTLNPRTAAQLIEALARAIHVAHERGIIHRDLKPANVLLAAAPMGTVDVTAAATLTHASAQWGVVLAAPGGPPTRYIPKITDFGLAKRLDEEHSHTQTGALLGTPSYMAPEQALGAAPSGSRAQQPVGHPVDLYALGAILYELLTGRPPFLADTPLDTVLQVLRDDPVPPVRLQPRVPLDLQTICLKCLEKEPRRRYTSALDLADDLARFAAGEAIRARPVGVAERALKWARRRPAVASLLALVLLTATTGFGLVTWKWLDAEHARAAERQQREAAELAREGERQQHEEAEQARLNEQRLRLQAEETLYLNRISLADRECAAANLRHAEDLLGLCPPDRRQWEWRYLMSLCHGELRSLDAHHAVVNHLTRSPDGKMIAAGVGQPYQADAQGTIILLDADTFQEIATLHGHLGAVSNVAFCANGTHLVSTARFTDLGKIIRNRADLQEATRGEVRVWNWQLRRTELHMPGYTSLAQAPDGKSLAGAALNQDVRVWDPKTRTVNLHLPHRWGIVTRLVYSPDGRWLAACWQDLQVAALAQGEVDLGAGTKTGTLVWDARTGVEYLTLAGDSDAEFSPDSKRLAVARQDKTARVWDLETKKEIAVFSGHTHLVNGLAFSADGKRLATASLDKTACVWDVDSGRLLRTLRGHNDMITSVVFTADGSAVVTGSWDGTIKVWNVGSEPAFRVLRGHTSFIADLHFAPDGRLIASAGPESVRLWDLEAGKEIFHLDGAQQCVSFRRDGQQLATGGRNDTVRVWDVADAAGGRPPAQVRELAGHTGRISAVAFRPDGQQLASASTGSKDGKKPGEVYLWDAGTGQQVGQLQGLKTSVLSLAWRPDGQRLATLSADGSARVWEPATGREVLVPRPDEFKGAYLSVGCVAYSHDGKRLAGAASNALDVNQRREVVIWDPDTGAVLTRLAGHSAPVSGLAFSPDGRRLASASWDINRGSVGEVKLWDVATGTEILTLPGHVSVAFSPDGRFLAGVGGDVLGASVIKVWDGGGR
jgi:WD40 repeat protein/serine/threonine protein kinase